MAAKSKDPSAIEMQHFLPEDDDPEKLVDVDNKAVGAKPQKQEGLYQRIVLSLDEHSNVKALMRAWQPRLEFVVRLMLVATFLDDSFHTATHFSEHVRQVGREGCLEWLMEASSLPALVDVIAALSLGAGLIAQLLGSYFLLALRHPDYSTKALIGWVIAQPFLYVQLSNVEFIAESLSLLGGLLMIRAHLVNDALMPATQFLGRLLLPAMYLHCTGRFLTSAFTLDETSSLGTYLSSLSMFVVNVALLVGLLIGSTLVAAGLKSRVVASVLALVNVGYVFSQHPFFLYIRREGGEWKYDEDNMSMPHVALPKDVSSVDFEVEQIYGLHRYYFFLGLSTSGALLLLAQFGPGKIAIQKDEVLLPTVARAQD